MFVLVSGEAAVVRAQITGSIIGTGLLGLGIAIVAGGIGRERQSFKRERAGLLSSLLILAVIALLLPAIFNLAQRAAGPQRLAITDEQLSIGVSVVLLALYAANLVYTLVTHRDVFASGESRRRRQRRGLAVMAGRRGAGGGDRVDRAGGRSRVGGIEGHCGLAWALARSSSA